MVFTDSQVTNSDADDDFDLDAPPARPLSIPSLNGARRSSPIANGHSPTSTDEETTGPDQEQDRSERSKLPMGYSRKVKWSDDESEEETEGRVMSEEEMRLVAVFQACSRLNVDWEAMISFGEQWTTG